MFRFFSRKKANLHSVSFPSFDWPQTKDDQAMKQWTHPTQPIALSVNFFDQKPDIPSIQNIHALREFYRRLVSEAGGGILEVTLMAVQGYPVIKTIFKFPQVPSGMTYLASLTIPFRDCSYVVKLQAMEMEPTGVRDGVVLDHLLEEGRIHFENDVLQGWMADPYDIRFVGGRLMNLAEEVAFDDRFPEHPLTQVRRRVDVVAAGLVFGEELRGVRGFGG